MPTSRNSTFDRVVVDYLVRGTTRVVWSLKPRFIEQGPYIFQLQASRIGGADWVNVGTSQTDIYYALDDERRLFGQDRRLVYRIVLTTGAGTHYSGEAEVMGKLTRQQWLLAREIIRRIAVKARGLKSFEGNLLKRRIDGQLCPACRDPLTGGITNADCATCKGTGYIDGYFLSAPLKMYDMAPDFRETHNREGTGTISPSVIPAKFIGLPLAHNRDIWIDKASDQRYVVHGVKHVSELNQVPLAVEAELRPLEFTDQAYLLEVP